jgi:hypothetical protein
VTVICKWTKKLVKTGSKSAKKVQKLKQILIFFFNHWKLNKNEWRKLIKGSFFHSDLVQGSVDHLTAEIIFCWNQWMVPSPITWEHYQSLASQSQQSIICITVILCWDIQLRAKIKRKILWLLGYLPLIENEYLLVY